MDTDGILFRYAEREGWNDATLVLLLSEYVDNQHAPDHSSNATSNRGLTWPTR